MKSDKKTNIKFNDSLDEKQFKKFVDFLSWLKKDKEKKDKNSIIK